MPETTNTPSVAAVPDFPRQRESNWVEAMQKYAVILTKTDYARVPEWLRERGIVVEPRPRLAEFEMHACRRDGVTVLLSMTQPAAWAHTTDGRQDLVVVAALGESVLRIWRLGREHRLRREVIDILRPHAWTPG